MKELDISIQDLILALISNTAINNKQLSCILVNRYRTCSVPRPMQASGNAPAQMSLVLAFSFVSVYQQLATRDYQQSQSLGLSREEKQRIICGKWRGLTSSNESRIRYRMVVTSRCWPTRCTRQRACSSIIGFQCGSKKIGLICSS